MRNKLEQRIPHHRITLICSPAGYGKTTLLAEWARLSQLPVAWLSLDRDDNDLERFLRYLLAAWETVQPEIVSTPLGLLLRSQRPEIEAALAALINAATQAPEHLVFALENYDAIQDPEIHEALGYLLDHLPERLHFILASRSEPPLPLARYRARGQLLEIGASELQFTLEETRIFLKQAMALTLPAEEVTALHASTEGWIAGLQLAGLARQRGGRSGEEAPLASGRQRFIADYLREEIFNELPDEEQDFLLKTSILERLCGPLCDAVCEEENGQVRLEALERENLFLIPLDDRREWYRYHSLFHEFLHSELQRRRPEESARLHRQAAGWHLEHGIPEAAFRHALEGRDPERISQILERYLMAKLMSGEIRMVKGWLEALPEAWRNQHPMFLLAQAGILLVTGQYEACSRCLDEVERLAVKKLGPGTEAPKKSAQARAISMRCNIACFQNDLARAEALAAEALKIMPAGELDFQAGVYGSLGDTYRRNGRWEEARESYRKLLDFTQAEGFRVQAVHVYGALADLELRQGHLRGADAYWEKALGAIRKRENWGNYPLPLTGWVFIRLAELAYERNRLVEAREFVAQGLERAELGGDVRAIIAGCVAAGRLELAEGEAEGADGYLERARPYTETAQFPYWNRRFERLQVELWLAGNRLRAAADWVDAKLSEAALAGPEREAEELAIARVLIVKGDEESNRRALRRLERLLQAAEAEGRGGIVIETLALQALAHAKEGELARALRALERALRLAEPEGYLRLFADFGLPMGQLLQEARSRGVLPEYTNTLLAAFDSSRFSPVGAGLRLPDPLTKREEQILELLAAGLTNPEIAGQLFISTETVKKHASNIYGKLGVSTRTEAAARARELHLLD